MLYIEYPKCSTCSKYKKELTEGGITLETRHIVEDNPSPEEIQSFHEKSALDIKKFFNTSGMKYRELGLKDKLPTMTLEEKYQVLASDGMLLKRPILVTESTVLLGKEVLKAL
ncbi:MAG: Spx/MgsR family RNA polymerase-binding regulatory protein [Eubacteriales bacterium]